MKTLFFDDFLQSQNKNEKQQFTISIFNLTTIFQNTYFKIKIKHDKN